MTLEPIIAYHIITGTAVLPGTDLTSTQTYAYEPIQIAATDSHSFQINGPEINILD